VGSGIHAVNQMGTLELSLLGRDDRSVVKMTDLDCSILAMLRFGIVSLFLTGNPQRARKQQLEKHVPISVRNQPGTIAFTVQELLLTVGEPV